MDCLKCEETDGLDRAIVDSLTGAEVGGLCEACLGTCRSPVFRDEIWRTGTDCAVCAGAAHYDLPLIDCRIEYPDGRPDEIEYVVTDETLRLCTDHLRVTLTESTADSQSTEAAISP